MCARIPPYLLVAVASIQICEAAVGHLTPWAGGGFGMFATLDSGSRIITVEGWWSEDTVLVRLPAPGSATKWIGQRDWSRLTAAPTEDELASLGRLVLAEEWSLAEVGDGIVLVPLEPTRAMAERVRLAGVRLTVFGVVFDGATDTMLRVPLLQSRILSANAIGGPTTS